MKTFRELFIWQKSMSLVTKTYQITTKFPKEELFGLTSQIRRSSVSIPSNISEGFGRETSKDFSRFLNVAISSLFEYQTQIEIAKNINYINEPEFKSLYEDSRELEIMMLSFIKKVKSNNQN